MDSKQPLRKGSLPLDYSLQEKNNSIDNNINDDWNREKISSLSHKARVNKAQERTINNGKKVSVNSPKKKKKKKKKLMTNNLFVINIIVDVVRAPIVNNNSLER